MSPRNHKRKRELSVPPADDIPTNSDLTHSKDVYMDDGNVIVAAKDVAFRVHRSQLARHSEVFRDKFAVVSPPCQADMYDGLHVVRLSDNPEDVLQLLRTIYDNPAVMEAFQEKFPGSLSKWEMRKTPNISLPERLMLIKVAYEANAQILLPALYLGLCSHPAAEILRPGKDLPHHMLAAHPSGKEELTSQLCGFIQDISIERSCDSSTCMGEWESLESISIRNLRDDVMDMKIDPLDSLDNMKDLFTASDACWSCKRDKTKAIWSSLPEVFGLVSWEHLRQASTHPEVP
ncbi:hypothetical protein JB92DRAFT_3129727 [Gautieria morchelliformis]|nr:hypothetical protein JB92DRAFT_3129727 [Gautieria morchelliformis]